MKEVTQEHRGNEAEILITSEQQKHAVAVGQRMFHKGLTTFEYNTVTGYLCKATFIETNARINEQGKTVIAHRIDVKKDCIYLQALNFKSAMRKLKIEPA